MIVDVYKKCPVYENEKFLLRFTALSDAEDLLKVYSDEKSVPLFNSDNCGGDDFHYTTLERMKQAIEYWHWEYSRKGFVRWSIVDKGNNRAIGTIEMFNRKSEDFFNNCGILRLDLRSDYENKEAVIDILGLIVLPSFRSFKCNKIATKAFPMSAERLNALECFGFEYTDNKLIGTHDGIPYENYRVIYK